LEIEEKRGTLVLSHILAAILFFWGWTLAFAWEKFKLLPTQFDKYESWFESWLFPIVVAWAITIILVARFKKRLPK